ncbi:uncharacterized protein LOC135849531 isoform X2 [Planococcus citri]|uniref:uncharacterized protein LOC135849531 isoform X2 n=1 Tax=Planococcus citri TaxID=170843 RepID=UPI0031FA27B9
MSNEEENHPSDEEYSLASDGEIENPRVDSIMAATFKLPSALIIDENLKENWRRFKRSFQNYLMASNLEAASENRKIAILKNVMGEEAEELLETLNVKPKTGQTTIKLDDIYDALEEYCAPKTNVTYQRHLFFSRKQQSNESFDQFLTDLKKLSKHCEFGDLESSLIMSFIIVGVNNNQLRQDLLRDNDLDLDKAIKYCRAQETSQSQANVMAKQIKSEEKEVFVLKKHRNEESDKQPVNRAEPKPYHCSRCDTDHKPRSCPAYGRRCLFCNGVNHFASCCFKNLAMKKSNTSKESSMRNKKGDNKPLTKTCNEFSETDKKSDDDEYVFDNICVDAVENNTNVDEWYETIKVNNTEIKMKLDCGAQCNVMPFNILKKIDKSIKPIPSNIRLSLYGKQSKIETIGSVILKCRVRKRFRKIKFQVVDCCDNVILGLKSCHNLNLVRRVEEIKIKKPEILNEEIFREFEHVFEGIGKLEGDYSFKLKEGATPVIKSTTRIPYALKEKVKKKLDALVEAGVIVPVDVPTEWVNSAIFFEKSSGEIRPCLNPADLNENLIPDPYPIPTSEEIALKFKDKKVKYLGMIIGEEGVEADDDYVQSIENMPEPKNREELMSFIGMVNFKAKEILKPHPVPELPYERIAVDIASYEALIKLLKINFANHGIPKVMIADNVPFNSQEFKSFANDWNFEIITTSPHHPKSNGLAEKAVGVVKRCLKKSERLGIDFEYMLLEHRNTPLKSIGYSPNQLLSSRITRTKIPVLTKKLQPTVVQNVREMLIKRQKTVEEKYNKNAKNVTEFKEGEPVLIYHNDEWESGEVKRKHETPRSYVVSGENGNLLRRNTIHIRKIPVSESHEESNNSKSSSEYQQEDQSIAVRRNRREIKPPQKLNL